jgi:hypothetical protein
MVDEDAMFCSNCGSKLSNFIEKPGITTSSSDTLRSSHPDDNGGKRGKSEQKVRAKFFYGKARYAHEVANVVSRFLSSNNLETQIIEADSEIIVQGKKKPNILNKALGLDEAITVGISVEGDDVKVTVGGAKWADKAVGATIGLLVFAPVLLTAGWGTYKQKKLYSEVEEEIEKFLSSKG